MSAKKKAPILLTPEARINSIVSNIKSLDSHRPETVFGDFVEMAAIAISNAVDLQQREKREKRYLEIAKGYKAEELAVIATLLGDVTTVLDAHPRDVMGAIWTGLELRGDWHGQFFTPYSVSKMMATMVYADAMKEVIEQHGFVTACEPCCGPGGMIVAMADALSDRDVNYQQTLHVTAADIDRRCVHMTYVQASLMHIPCMIYRGDTLRNEFDEVWYTPAHILGGWNWKLRQREAREKAKPAWQRMDFGNRIALLTAHNADAAGALAEYVPLDVPVDALQDAAD
jgi:hypothetical protein